MELLLVVCLIQELFQLFSQGKCGTRLIHKTLAPVNRQCNLVDAQGSSLNLIGSASIELQLGPQLYSVNALIAERLTTDLILGKDFLK